MRPQRNVGDGLADAAFDQHAVEATTGPDDQQDRRGRPQAVVCPLQDLVARDVPAVAQRPEGKEQGNEQRDEGTAHKVEHLAKRAAGLERHVGDATAQHQDDRQQHREERNAKPGELSRHLAAELSGDGVVGRQGDARCDPRGENRAGQRRRGEPDEKRIGNRPADVGPIRLHRQHRRGMRRHHAVHDREPRDQGNAHLHQGDAGAARNRED